MGTGAYPVPSETSIAEEERKVEMNFKAIEQRKVPEDQGVSADEKIMGAWVVVWSNTMDTAI
jgi:hypothetical protein